MSFFFRKLTLLVDYKITNKYVFNVMCFLVELAAMIMIMMIVIII